MGWSPLAQPVCGGMTVVLQRSPWRRRNLKNEELDALKREFFGSVAAY